MASDDYTDFNENITAIVARWPKPRAERLHFRNFRARRRHRHLLRVKQQVIRAAERQRRDKYRPARVCACGYVIQDRGVICEQCRYNLREHAFADAQPGDIIRWSGRRYRKMTNHVRMLCRKCSAFATVDEFCEQHLPTITITPEHEKIVDGICPLYDCDCDKHTYESATLRESVRTLLPYLRRWRFKTVVVERVENRLRFTPAAYLNPDNRMRVFVPHLGVVYTNNLHHLRYYPGFWQSRRRYGRADHVARICDDVVAILVAMKHDLDRNRGLAYVRGHL